jgi:hypothetical protein
MRIVFLSSVDNNTSSKLFDTFTNPFFSFSLWPTNWEWPWLFIGIRRTDDIDEEDNDEEGEEAMEEETGPTEEVGRRPAAVEVADEEEALVGVDVEVVFCFRNWAALASLQFWTSWSVAPQQRQVRVPWGNQTNKPTRKNQKVSGTFRKQKKILA